jgi:hypothetical protein
MGLFFSGYIYLEFEMPPVYGVDSYTGLMRHTNLY